MKIGNFVDNNFVNNNRAVTPKVDTVTPKVDTVTPKVEIKENVESESFVDIQARKEKEKANKEKVNNLLRDAYRNGFAKRESNAFVPTNIVSNDDFLTGCRNYLGRLKMETLDGVNVYSDEEGQVFVHDKNKNEVVLARETNKLDKTVILALLQTAKTLLNEIEVFGDEDFVAMAKKVADENGIKIFIRDDGNADKNNENKPRNKPRF